MLFYLIALALVAGTYAQSYTCSSGSCSGVFPDRKDLLGCEYFCYLDANGDGFLGRLEVQLRFRTWNNGAATCDRTCFVTNFMNTLAVCETEANTAFDNMALLGDDNPDDVSNLDVNAYYAILEEEEGGTPVGPAAFRRYWLATSNLDPNCDRF